MIGQRCHCDLCELSRALERGKAAHEAIEAGVDAVIEMGAEDSMALSWLLDEVANVIASRRSWLVRKRLRRALAIAGKPK